jgi:hypothetical protein
MGAWDFWDLLIWPVHVATDPVGSMVAVLASLALSLLTVALQRRRPSPAQAVALLVTPAFWLLWAIHESEPRAGLGDVLRSEWLLLIPVAYVLVVAQVLMLRLVLRRPASRA